MPSTPQKRPAASHDISDESTMPGTFPEGYPAIRNGTVASVTVGGFVRRCLASAMAILPARFLKYFSIQRIQPVSVAAANGSRKRIALDAGSAPVTPNTSRHMPGSWIQSPDSDDDTEQMESDEELVDETAMDIDDDLTADVYTTAIEHKDQNTTGNIFEDNSFVAHLPSNDVAAQEAAAQRVAAASETVAAKGVVAAAIASPAPAVAGSKSVATDNGTSPHAAALDEDWSFSDAICSTPPFPQVKQTASASASPSPSARFLSSLRPRAFLPPVSPLARLARFNNAATTFRPTQLKSTRAARTPVQPFETPKLPTVEYIISPCIWMSDDVALPSASDPPEAIYNPQNIFTPVDEDETSTVAEKTIDKPYAAHSPTDPSRKVIQHASAIPLKPFNKRLDPNYLSPKEGGRHTSMRPFHTLKKKNTYENPIAEQLKRAAVAKAARHANAQYKAAHDARVAKTSQSEINATSSKATAGNNDAFEYVNDLSTLSDAPPPPPKKSISWADENHERRFFRDRAIDEAHESFIAAMKSPAKDEVEASLIEEASVDGPSGLTDDKNDFTVGGFAGIPASTFENSDSSDDSLDESMVSVELCSELAENLQVKAVLEEPAATIPPLIAPLTDTESQILSNASKVCNKGLSREHVLANKLQTPLKARDFATLLPAIFSGDPRAWLNDDIVNEYLSVLVKHEHANQGYVFKRDIKGPAPPVHAFSSNWYNTITKTPASMNRWAKAVNMTNGRIFDTKLILLPFCTAYHWRLISIKPQERTIEYHDSLGGTGEEYIKHAHAFLKHALENRYVKSEWTALTKQRSMIQDNASDCGIFTVLNALVMLRGEEHNRVISIKGMEDARRRVAITLLTGKTTGEMD
ncbi:hypothetical protein CC80DRAFT_473604 [Byssothecium circinans]|uniref:Ubiquitin-like protease family profile domain-containing protein n=1 Tax=Byssothecium circinans TaxID=147558 RepID=A0A6A5TVU4_9PLEO|nr:hypothetical protein CC80DRAFT_473604 [Byssothecium circinans]